MTVKNEGISALFKGTVARAVAITPLNSLVFASFAKTMRVMDENNWLPNQPIRTSSDGSGSGANASTVTPNYGRLFVAGTVAGFIQSFISSPAELVKCRMQIQNTTSGAKPLYASSWDCLRGTFRHGGVPALYRGLASTLARDTTGYSVYWVANHWTKHQLATLNGSNHRSGDTLPVWQSLTAGGFSGIMTWLVCYPFDSIKSVIQIAPLSTPRAELTMAAVARAKYREYGAPFFFRGMATTLVRAVPVNAVVFFGYELTLRHLSTFD